MLVAPVSRSAIVIGKCLGGATVSTFQGIVILALAGLAHVPYNPVLLLTVIGELLLLSFTLTAFGVMMAARIKQIQAFMALTQMLVMPLFFLSGAVYPMRGLPGCRCSPGRDKESPKLGRRWVATGANHPASHHRRSDGGPERRQRCPDGGPEHRYEWYTSGPWYVSRPNDK